MSTPVLTLTEQTIDEQVTGSDLPVIVEFSAEWCPPCKVIEPVLQAIANDYRSQLRVFRINVDECPELARRFDILGVPTLLVFSDGELRQRLVGARGRVRLLEDLAEWIS